MRFEGIMMTLLYDGSLCVSTPCRIIFLFKSFRGMYCHQLGVTKLVHFDTEFITPPTLLRKFIRLNSVHIIAYAD